MRTSFLVLLAALVVGRATAQPVVINVPTPPTWANLLAAFTAANRYTGLSSAVDTVTVRLPAAYIGATLVLTRVPYLYVDHLRVEVQGAGPADRVILDASAVTGALRPSCRDAQFRNLTFANTGAAVVPAVGYDCIIATGTNDLLFANCTFAGNTGQGLWLVGCPRTTVQDCSFTGNPVGIGCYQGSDDLTVLRTSFANTNVGISVGACARPLVRDCTFTGHLLNGMVCRPVCTNVVFGPGNVVQTSTGPGLQVDGGIAPLIAGNSFLSNAGPSVLLIDRTYQARVIDNAFSGGASVAGQAQLVLADVVGAQIRGNSLRNGQGEAIQVNRSVQVAIGPSAAVATTVVAGHARAGITATGCVDLSLTALDVRGTLANGAAGAQLRFFDCVGVNVIGTAVTLPGAGPTSSGVSFTNGGGLTIGVGTVVSDHTAFGVVVQHAGDVVLGVRSAGIPGAGLTISNNHYGVQCLDCTDVRVNGDPAVPGAETMLLGNGQLGGGICLDISGNSRAVELGPGLTVDAVGRASTAVQLDPGVKGVLMRNLTVRGHATTGIRVNQCSDVEIRSCTVDGGATATATGAGISVSQTDNCRLFGNLARRHGGDGFFVDSSPGILIGPGNRSQENVGNGITALNTQGLVPPPVVVVQSCAVLGRGPSAGIQRGMQMVDVDARIGNVSVTRCAYGLDLVRTAGTPAARVVNSIFHGNTTQDRAVSPGFSVASMNWSIYGTSGGSGWSGSNNLVNTAANYPGFVNAAGQDLHLLAGSPAIDSGTHYTPLGLTLPCADLDLLARVRGARVDRGCCETPGAANTLDVLGNWLRSAHDSALELRLNAPGSGVQPFLLLGTGSGTGPGYPAANQLPIVGDALTALLMGNPTYSTGLLDGLGRAKVRLPIPAEAVLLLPPELTFAFTLTPAMTTTSNPVVVRFLR